MVKCSSSSTGPAGGVGPEDVVDGVLVLGGKQYVHILLATGVTGLVQRPFSIPRKWLPVLSLTKNDFWFLFLTRSMYGSLVKLDLYVL